jgi:hypothetical protein
MSVYTNRCTDIGWQIMSSCGSRYSVSISCGCGGAVKLNATITLVNGDYLTSDMCLLLLGYMAEQVLEQPVSVLTAMPTLAMAIVNQTQVMPRSLICATCQTSKPAIPPFSTSEMCVSMMVVLTSVGIGVGYRQPDG